MTTKTLIDCQKLHRADRQGAVITRESVTEDSGQHTVKAYWHDWTTGALVRIDAKPVSAAEAAAKVAQLQGLLKVRLATLTKGA